MDNILVAKLEAIEARLTSIEQLLRATRSTSQSTTKESVSPIPAASSERPLSVTEYVLQKHPNDDNQRTIVLASYLEKYKSQTDFTADELRQAFIESRLRIPTNVSDKIGKRLQKGQLMVVGERDGKKT